jgi:serine/threonine protein kinase
MTDLVSQHALPCVQACGRRCGWVHRDVKPSNIMSSARAPPAVVAGYNTAARATWLQRGVTWKLIDFGSAMAVPANVCAGMPMMTTTQRLNWGWVVHTPAYAPPEDLLGTRPSNAAAAEGIETMASSGPAWVHPSNDMWSVGCVLYEAATGVQLVDVPRCRQLLLQTQQEQQLVLHEQQQQQVFPWWRGLGATSSRCSSSNSMVGSHVTPTSDSWTVQALVCNARAWLLQRVGHVRSLHCGLSAPGCSSSSSSSTGYDVSLPIDALEDEDIQLWQLTQMLGPPPSDVSLDFRNRQQHAPDSA